STGCRGRGAGLGGACREGGRGPWAGSSGGPGPSPCSAGGACASGSSESRPRAARPAAREGTMRRSRWWFVVPLIAVAACGSGPPAPMPVAGQPKHLTISLTTVPTVRSITISPNKAAFGNCQGGNPGSLTRSTHTELGFPDAHCWVGAPGAPGSYPIKITNKGVASQIDVYGQDAVPSDGGTQWSL